MEQHENSLLENKIAEVELVYKTKVKAKDRLKILTSQNAYIILRQSWKEGTIELQEQFKVLLLNRANAVLGIMEVSSGGLTGTVADPKLIFIAALKAAATSIVLCHNHPSGNLKPSRADEELTRKIKGAGEFLDITVLDHLIITDDAYFSFADEGFL